jgi:hypothetical protein
MHNFLVLHVLSTCCRKYEIVTGSSLPVDSLGTITAPWTLPVLIHRWRTLTRQDPAKVVVVLVDTLLSTS